MKIVQTRKKRMDRRGRSALRLLVAILIMSLLPGALVWAGTLYKEIHPAWTFEVENEVYFLYNPVTRLWVDGEHVFCVQAEKINESGDVYYDPVDAATVFDPATLNRIGLVGHYGYEATDKSWLTAAFAKMKVYEAVGYTIGALYDESGGGDFTRAAYDQYSARLEEKIQGYYVTPSFDQAEKTLVAGETRELVDEKGVLSGFRVRSTPAGVSAWIEGSSLFIRAEAGGEDGRITLERDLLNIGTSLVYFAPDRQTMVKAMVDDPVLASVDVTLDRQGGFTLKKVDESGQLLAGSRFLLTGGGQEQELQVSDGELVLTGLTAGDYTLQEIVAPPGYRLDERPRTVRVQAGDLAANVEIAVVNEPEEANLEIEKEDENGQPVAGVEFELAFDADFTVGVQRQTSGVDGRAYFSSLKLAYGNEVWLRETTAPAQLILDDTVHTLSLLDGQTHRLKIQNRFASAQLCVWKKDERGQPLSGVVFRLTLDGESREGSTNEQGFLLFDGLAVGEQAQVQLVEISVPAPFLLDSDQRELTLAAGESRELEIINERARGQIDLEKRTPDGAGLEAVHFELRDEEDVLVAAGQTDEEGRLRFADLELGGYRLLELAAPAGYYLNPEPLAIELVYAGDTVPVVRHRVELENRLVEGQIEIYKAGEQGPLAGVLFGIFDEAGREVARLLSDESGQAVSPRLPYGIYTVRELEAPEIYYLSEEEQEARIENEGDLIALEWSNELVLVHLLVHKLDADSQEPLAGAVFEIYDADGQRLPVREGDLEDPATFQLVTAGDGRAASLVPLAVGRYRLVEILAPPGYARSRDQEFQVRRDSQTIELPWLGRALEQLVGNEATRVRVQKIDALTGDALTGALLLLSEEESGAVVDVWRSTEKAHELRQLPAGRRYRLSEILAPAGYALAEDQVFVVQDTEDWQEVFLLNEPLAVEIRKVERGGQRPVAGAVFQLFDLYDRPVLFVGNEEGVYRPDQAGHPDLVSDLEGRIRLWGLEPGHYVLVEKEAPGCLLNEERQVLKPGRRNGLSNPYLLTLENEVLSVQIEKREKGREGPLAGAVFQLLDAEGQVLCFHAEEGAGWRPATEGGQDRLPVDAEGSLQLLALPPGAYQLVELEAPLGYRRLEEAVAFDVTGRETEALRLVVENEAENLPRTGQNSPWPWAGLLLLWDALALALARVLWRRRQARLNGQQDS